MVLPLTNSVHCLECVIMAVGRYKSAIMRQYAEFCMSLTNIVLLCGSFTIMRMLFKASGNHDNILKAVSTPFTVHWTENKINNPDFSL